MSDRCPKDGALLNDGVCPNWNCGHGVPVSRDTPSERRETGKTQVRLNAEENPSYAPYCLACRSMDRMREVERFYWRCGQCRAEHDERVPASPREKTSSEIRDEEMGDDYEFAPGIADVARLHGMTVTGQPLPTVAEERWCCVESLTRHHLASGKSKNDALLAAEATVDALCAAVRREFAAEVRTRLVATDPVGLKTGPLYDWLTKEMTP